jgi:hypothetical protein
MDNYANTKTLVGLDGQALSRATDCSVIAENREHLSFDNTSQIVKSQGEYPYAKVIDGWLLDGATEQGLIESIASLYGKGTLYTPQRILKMIRDIKQQVDNPSVPWLKAALDKRYSFIFREDIRIEGDTSALDAIRKIPGNQNFLKPVWNEQFSHTKDIEGNVFLVKNKKTGRIFFLPFAQIQDIYTDVEDDGYITHIKVNTSPTTASTNRSTSGKTYIIERYNNTVSARTFRNSTKETDPINHNYIFWDFHSSRVFGEPLARPPLLLATLYTSAAARYYADLSRYLHSSSLLAMKAVSATREGAKRGVEEIASIRNAGAIAGLTQDYTVSGVASNGLNVTSNTGISMLAAAAASVNIPVSQFAMTVEGSSGTAGSLVTLDISTRSYYASQQNITIDFYKEILGDGIEISFVGNSADSVIKNVTSATTAYTNKAIFQQEYRNFVIDQLNIENPLAGLPEIIKITEPANGGNTPTAVSRDSGHDNEPGLDGAEA